MSATLTMSAAFATGLLASGHCVGMCGPMAALGARAAGSQRIRRAGVYNVARLVSYASVGALFGALGVALGSAAAIESWALVLRVGLGAVMLLIGIRLLLARRGASLFERAGARLWRRIAPLARGLDPAGRTRDVFLLGLLWGYLPCGMVYSMLAVAALSGSAGGGALTMLAFGAGTLPAMLGMTLAGSHFGILRKPGATRVLGAVLMLSGVWLAAMPLYHSLPGGEAAPHAHHAHH